MEKLITTYGLPAIFLSAAVEGDVTMILAGVLAHIGLVTLPQVILAGWMGACLSDSFLFSLGRIQQERIRQSRIYQRVGPYVEGLVARLGPSEVIVARFIYGSRSASMLLWGMVKLAPARFLLLDALGCLLWATLLGTVGFTFSGSVALLIGDVKRAERWLLVAAVSAAGLIGSAHYVLRRVRTKAASAAPPPPAPRA